MGCISSKLLREQASVDDGLSIFPVQISPKMKPTKSSVVQSYHRHCVSLTSTSYGFMKVDSPIKSSIMPQKKISEKEVTLTEMYGKLSDLGMDEAIQKKKNLKNLKKKTQINAADYKSNVRMDLSSPENAISESIDVKEMMMGLEEPALTSSSSSSSLSQVLDESVHESASQTNFSTSTKPKRRQIDNQRPDKKKLRLVKNVGISLGSNTEMDNNGEEEELGKENSIPNIANTALKPTRSPLLLRKESIASNRFLLRPIDHAIVPMNGLSPSKPHVMMKKMMMMKKYSIPCTPPSAKMNPSSSNLVSTEPNSPLFDPELVASYEEDLVNLSGRDWDSRHKSPIRGLDRRIYDPLESFEAKCPPSSGHDKVVIYTTTLRGIRKTFDDCNVARAILRNFDVVMDERDVSMHLEFLNELRELMGKVVSVPRIFIKGRYIGGIDEIGKLHEDGKLSELLEGLPKVVNKGDVCDGCGGVRFVPCLECNGSRKVRIEGNHRVLRCSECNENGLIQCPICT